MYSLTITRASTTNIVKQSAKLGLGVSIEAAPEELQEQQEAAGGPSTPANIPF